MTEHVVIALGVENPTTLQSRSKIFPSDIEMATAEVLPAQTPLTTSTQEPCSELKARARPTSAPKPMSWSGMVIQFWLVGPPMGLILEKVVRWLLGIVHYKIS